MIYGTSTRFPDGERVWLVRNGDGGVTVLRRDFPGAVGFSAVADTAENAAAGALPARAAMEAHWRRMAAIYG